MRKLCTALVESSAKELDGGFATLPGHKLLVSIYDGLGNILRGRAVKFMEVAPQRSIRSMWGHGDVLGGTRDGAKAGRLSRRRMPNIDKKQQALGAVLCFGQ